MNNINVFVEHPKFIFSNQSAITHGLLSIFLSEGVTKQVELNIILLEDDALLEINKSYLQHDYYTDIITFPIEETEERLEAELYISVDRVKENAINLKVNEAMEFHRVLIHGVLHLCGYNDKLVEEIEVMRKKEKEYLNLECFT